MADAQQYRPKSDRLPKGVFRPTLPKRAVLMVVAIDGVPEWLMMAEGGDEKALADFRKLKSSYAEMVGEDAGHYVVGTAHVVEVQDDGVVAVGNAVVVFEDGVRSLTRVPTLDEGETAATPAQKRRNGNGKTKPKPSTAKKPVAAKTQTAKRTTAKRTTAKKTTSAKRPTTRRTKPKPRKR